VVSLLKTGNRIDFTLYWRLMEVEKEKQTDIPTQSPIGMRISASCGLNKTYGVNTEKMAVV